jgi:hypothetical protein
MIGRVQKIISSGIFVKNDPFRCFIARQIIPEEMWDNIKLSNEMSIRLKEFRYNDNEIMCVGEPIY